MQVYAKLQLLTENKLEWNCSYSLKLKLLQKPIDPHRSPTGNFNRKRALVIPVNYNLLDSQNNRTHVNRVICAKDGAKVTRHLRGHERNSIIDRKLIEDKQLDSKWQLIVIDDRW